MSEAIEIEYWNVESTDYKEETVGDVRIKRINYKKGIYNNYMCKGKEYFRVIKPIPVTLLQIKDKGKKRFNTWMVDDPPHYWSMQEYAEKSEGNVLVAGFGLGLIIHCLLKNEKVKSITILERHSDVIELMKKYFRDEKIKILNKDFFDFLYDDTNKFDSVIVDLWVSNNKKQTHNLMISQISTYRCIQQKYGCIPIFFHGFANQLREICKQISNAEYGYYQSKKGDLQSIPTN